MIGLNVAAITRDARSYSVQMYQVTDPEEAVAQLRRWQADTDFGRDLPDSPGCPIVVYCHEAGVSWRGSFLELSALRLWLARQIDAARITRGELARQLGAPAT